MSSSNFGAEPNFPDPFDRHLAGRLRRIAETQRAPAELRDRVFAELAAQRLGERRWLRWDLVAAGMGGALLSAAAAITIWIAAPNTAPRTGESATAWFDVALNNVMGEAYLQTDRPATLRTWFEAQVSHDIDVPAIPDADLRGGRLAYLGGIRGAAIEYRLNDLPLTYLMVPDDVVQAFANPPDSMVTWTERGYRIVMWRQDGTTRALVAPMPRSELIQIAEHCRRTMI